MVDNKMVAKNGQLVASWDYNNTKQVLKHSAPQELPQTGDNNNSSEVLTSVGLSLLAFLGLFGLGKKRNY